MLASQWILRAKAVVKVAILSALLLSGAWILAWLRSSNPAARDYLGWLITSLLELLLLTLLVMLLLWWLRERQIPTILQFQNLTGDAHYDGIAAGFANLLSQEMGRIYTVRSEATRIWGPEDMAPIGLSSNGYVARLPPSAWSLLRGREPLGPASLPAKLKNLPRAANVAGGEFSGVVTQVGTVGLGPVNLPLGGLLNLALSILQVGQISGNFQKHGPDLTIVVTWAGRGSWHIRSGTLPSGFQSEGQLIHAMARQLAHHILWETKYRTSSNWQSFQEWISGLEVYCRYRNSRGRDVQALTQARACFERAVNLDPDCALAQHALGVVCAEQGLTATAIEMYRRSLELDPSLPEVHFSLALAYAPASGKLEEAIQACQKAVQLDRHFAAAQHFLGDWLISAVNWSDVEAAAARYRQAATAYRWAIRGYEQALKNARRSRLLEAEDERSSATMMQLAYRLGRALFSLGKAYLELAELSTGLHLLWEPWLSRWHSRRANQRGQALLQQIGIGASGAGPALESYYDNKELGKLYLDWAQQEWEILTPTLSQSRSKKSRSGVDAALQEQAQRIDQRLEMAILAFESVLATTPEDAGAWGDLAWAHRLRGLLLAQTADEQQRSRASNELKVATAMLGKALALTPQDPTHYERLLDIHANKGKLEPASGRALPRAKPQSRRQTPAPSEDMPPEARAYNELAQVIRTAWTVSDAGWVIAEIVRLAFPAPKSEARAVAQRLPAASAAPKDAPTQIYLWALGWLLIRLGQPDPGLKYLSRTLTMGEFPEAALAHIDLAQLYEQQQERKQALAELKEAQERYLQPYLVSQPLRLVLARQLAEVGFAYEQYVDAIQLYSEAIALAGENTFQQAELLAGRGQAQLARKAYIDALRDCQEAAKLVPTYAFPFVIMASAFMEMQDYRQAIEAWNRVAELAPGQLLGPYHHALGNAKYRLALACDEAQAREALYQEAVQAYQQAIAQYGLDELEDKARAHADLALVLSNLKQYKAATLAGEQALALAKDSPDAFWHHMQLADLYVKQKWFTVAEQHYREAIRLGELGEQAALAEQRTELAQRYRLDVAEARNLIAYYLCAEQGVNLEEGLRQIELALEQISVADAGHETRGAYLDTRAWLYYKLGDYDRAIDDLQNAIALTMGTVEERYHLALAFERKAEMAGTDAERRQHLTHARAEWEHVSDLDVEIGERRPKALERLRQLSEDDSAVRNNGAVTTPETQHG